MKYNPQIVLLILFFAIAGCKKDNQSKVTAKSLVGHWYSMFNYQWYGEVILNEDGTGEIIHYPPYATDTSKTPVEWTNTDSSFCWSYLGSPDKCMSNYKITYFSADSIVMYQNSSSGWYAQLTKRNNYKSVITKPYANCLSPYFYDTTKYSISLGTLDPGSTYYFNNSRAIIEHTTYTWNSYNEHLNFISGNLNLFEVTFAADTGYNVKSINNHNASTGELYPYFNYAKTSGYLVKNNERTIISIPNSDHCSGELINDNNIVAGKVQYGNKEKLFIYNNGTIDTLSIPYPRDVLRLVDINNKFILAYYESYTDNIEHYFKVYLNRSIVPLNFNENYHFTATNNNGQIAGTLYIPTISCNVYPFTQGNITLGIVLEPDNSLSYYAFPGDNPNSSIRDINDNGDLLGFNYASYNANAFILKRR